MATSDADGAEGRTSSVKKCSRLALRNSAQPPASGAQDAGLETRQEIAQRHPPDGAHRDFSEPMVFARGRGVLDPESLVQSIALLEPICNRGKGACLESGRNPD